ncbi:hypothetical protein ACQ86N_18245 [Puia sp. P3]|uniref:hypothetical protein n=1 Tax=Puia sp. P3 TaxID=3423952 RepID=UPI003D676B64
MKVNDIPANFTMQFDLGAVKTVIYGKSIKPYLAAYPALKSRIDTSKKFLIQGENNPVFTNMELRTDGINFKAVEVGYFENFGSQISPDSIYSKTEKHIGTIGPDLFKNSILIIDYPGKKSVFVRSCLNG